MNAIVKHEQPEPLSVLASLATHYGMDRRAFEATLRATVMPKDATNEQQAAFLLVAREHKLNPFTKEIFAFPSRGGIQPVVSVDGWMKLINSHAQFDGMKFHDVLDEKGKLISVTCQMYRKDRAHPVEVTEYMSECYRKTDTWDRWPARMLRHKAAIQASRYAFGFAGIMEPDEAERAQEVELAPEQVTAERLAQADIKPRIKLRELPEEDQERVRKIGLTVREYFDGDDLNGALDYLERNPIAAEERIAMDELLTSTMRTALTVGANTRRKMESQ